MENFSRRFFLLIPNVRRRLCDGWHMPNDPNITISSITYTADGNTQTVNFPAASAVKAVGDWELDVLAIPFHSIDSDGQWFDESTDIMDEAFQTPLGVYQHGIKQGAKALQEKIIVIGKTLLGTLRKMSDGWHLRMRLDPSKPESQEVMKAAREGKVAVSSGSVSHLARLDVGGKIIPYEKNRKGRIAAWPLAEVSLWGLGNGNIPPANALAYAMPVMKAIYKSAGLQFPDVQVTDGVLPEASNDAAKRARNAEIEKAKQILQRTRKWVED
jgi:hypothetical protein